MDSIKAKKFQGMKKYRKTQFLRNNIFHLLAGLTCSLLFSNPFWFPSLCSSMKQFLLISLPCVWSSFFNPKCLFVVVNVIIIFLVGESGLVGRNTSSPARDIYDDYMQRSRSLAGFSVSAPHEKIRQPLPQPQELKPADTVEDYEDANSKEENEELVETKEVITSEDKEPKQEEETSEIAEEEEEAYHEEHDQSEIIEEEVELPAEELNKRVEEFIARVNKQRWLEAQLLVCCKA